MKENSETEIPEVDAPLLQGDILCLPGRASPPHIGVIINADCDLANRKTDGVIAFLPVYTFEEYLEHFWIESFIQGEKTKWIDKIGKLFDATRRDKVALGDWLGSEDSQGACEALSSEEGLSERDEEKLRCLVDEYMQAFIDPKLPQTTFSVLCRLKTNPDTYARKQLKIAFSSTGDGHLLINEIKGKDFLGFIVRTRRIYSLTAERCFRCERDFKASKKAENECAFRISRLLPTFKFKIVNMFAYQFSRVGLPDEHVELQSLVIEDLAQKMLEVAK